MELWIQVHSQIVSIRHNPEFQNKMPDRHDSKHCQETQFLSILHSNPPREKKPSYIGDRLRISKDDSTFRKAYELPFTPEVFEIVKNSSRIPPTYPRKDEEDEIKRDKFLSRRVDQSHLAMDSFTVRLVSNASSQLFPDNTLSSSTNFLPEQLKLEGQREVTIPETSYASKYQNVTEGKSKFFDLKNFQIKKLYSMEPDLYPSVTDIVEAMNTPFQERHYHSESCITVKVSLGTQFLESMFAGNWGVMLRVKGPHKPELAYDIVRKNSLMIYTDLNEYKIVVDKKVASLCCFRSISK